MEQENTPDSPPATGNLYTAQGDAPPPVITDAHGFNPDDYDWVPVRKKRRVDGWSPERQRRFIEILADTGSVRQAAQLTYMTAQSAYALRRSPGAEGFAKAWDIAIEHASRNLVDTAFDRALHGVDDPVVDKFGRVFNKTKYNDRLLMFLLRAHGPDRYRFAHRDSMTPGEVAPPLPQPLAEAIRLLDPVMPDEPHKLMSPEDLDIAVQVADLLPEGELPRWHRDPALVEGEREERAVAEGKDPYPSPTDEALERQLASAKRAAAGLPPAEEDADDPHFFSQTDDDQCGEDG